MRVIPLLALLLACSGSTGGGGGDADGEGGVDSGAGGDTGDSGGAGGTGDTGPTGDTGEPGEPADTDGLVGEPLDPPWAPPTFAVLNQAGEQRTPEWLGGHPTVLWFFREAEGST